MSFHPLACYALRDCPGFVLDMRCDEVRDRAASFHRIRDCMFTELSLVALADAYRGEAPLCVLTTGHPSPSNPDFGILSSHAAFLPAMLTTTDPGPPTLPSNHSGAQWLLNRGSAAANSTTRPARFTFTLINSFGAHHFVGSSPGKRPTPLNVSICQTQLGFSIRPQQLVFANELAGWLPGLSKASRLFNLHDMLRRRLPPLEHVHRHVVLVQRNGTRSFDDVEELSASLASASRRPIKIYSGEESVSATLDLFASAVGVVGFHGAGLVNSLLVPGPVCLMEVSTHLDNGTRWPFRTVNLGALDITGLHPALNYSTHWLPVMDIVEASRGVGWMTTYIEAVTRFGVTHDFHGETTGAWRKVEQMLKILNHIPTTRDREAMGRRLTDCLAHMAGTPAETRSPDVGYLQRVVEKMVPAAFRDAFQGTGPSRQSAKTSDSPPPNIQPPLPPEPPASSTLGNLPPPEPSSRDSLVIIDFSTTSSEAHSEVSASSFDGADAGTGGARGGERGDVEGVNASMARSDAQFESALRDAEERVMQFVRSEFGQLRRSFGSAAPREPRGSAGVRRAERTNRALV